MLFDWSGYVQDSLDILYEQATAAAEGNGEILTTSMPGTFVSIDRLKDIPVYDTRWGGPSTWEPIDLRGYGWTVQNSISALFKGERQRSADDDIAFGTAPAQDYYYSMDHIVDPVEYALYLKLFRSAGLDEFPYSKLDGLREIVESKMLLATFNVLDVSLIQDLPSLINYYSTLINRILPQFEAILKSPEHLRLGGLDITVSLTQNQISGTMKVFNDAAWLIKSHIIDLEAQIATLEDPAGQQESQLPDERNPFLVFDPVESKKRGVPTYRNVARNEWVSFGTTPEYVERGFRTLDAYEKAAEIYNRYRRTVPTVTGYKSPADIGQTPEAGSLVPWLVAAGIAAAAATQF